MRYKIVKHYYTGSDRVIEYFYVMCEKKVWWKKELVWRRCKENNYDYTIDVHRSSLKEAEDYILLQMKIDNGDFQPEDIKIYECRDSKLNKILND
jgi:hypothetical protein